MVGVFRCVEAGDGRDVVVVEEDGIELYGCQRTLVRVAGGARWAREWDTACIYRRK